MKVTIEKITLLNFKGIVNREINFTHRTDIYGDNATGKTTIFDALTWLLFGKNSEDVKDFNIKTIDSTGKSKSKLDHEVSGVFLVNDMDEITFKRIYKEKWVKRRGESESEFTGHETVLLYNDVPMQAGEYSKKVDAIINEQLFKMVTSTSYFNAMKWQDRRNVLIKIAGEISDDSIFDSLITIQNKGAYTGIINAINAKKNLDEYKSEITAKKTKINNELKLIPARIDEINRNMPAMPNESEINGNIKLLNGEIEKIDNQIEDKTKITETALKAIQEKQKEQFTLTEKLNSIEYQTRLQLQKDLQGADNTVNIIKNNITKFDNNVKAVEQCIKDNELRRDNLNNQAEKLREKWQVENEKTLEFKDNEFICPACKREFETDDITTKRDKMLTDFNDNKIALLEGINKEGQQLVKQVDEINLKLNDDSAVLQIQKGELDIHTGKLKEATATGTKTSPKTIEQLLTENIEYQNLKTKIEAIKNEKQESPVADVSSLKIGRQEYQNDIKLFNEQLALIPVINKNKIRIKELSDQEKTLSQELASFEKIEFAIANYTKVKIDTVSQRVKIGRAHV